MGKQVIIWALGFFLLGASASWAEDIVVIVNNNVVVNSLTAQEIKDIYLGETEYFGNEQVAPVSYRDGIAIRGEFLHKVLNTKENAYKTYWIKQMFREGGIPPRSASSAREVIEIVSGNKGGIGFVYASELVDTSNLKEVFRVSN